MKPCFGYVRVSTVKQGEGVSLEAQRDAILAFASRNNIEITQWFEEKETAAKSGRPIFLSMMKMLMKRKAQGVVLHKVDRGARNLADWAKFADLADAGIDVHFATEALDFRSRGGRLTADIQAVIAADYIRNLREECIKGIDGRLKQGLYPFKAPIGYLDHGGGKVKTIDPIKGPLVRRAFELYATGEYSMRSLPNEMSKRGLLNSHGSIISKVGMEKMLRNPFYCGLIRISRGKSVFQGVHDALVAPSLFEQVRAVREGRTAKAVTKHRYLFRGLFACGLCGTAMIAERQKGHVYYRCHTSRCETKTVREEALHTEIELALVRVRFTDANIEWLIEHFDQWVEQRAHDPAAGTYPMQVAQIEDRLKRLTDALVDRVIERGEYAERKESLLIEKAKVSETLERRKLLPDAQTVRKFLERIKSLTVTYGMAENDEKRSIVQLATSNRLVFRKNVVVEPADWLVQLDLAIVGLFGGDSRPDSRSSPEMKIERFAECMRMYEKEKDDFAKRSPSMQ